MAGKRVGFGILGGIAMLLATQLIAPGEAHAGWKMRGWYMAPKACVMKSVTVKAGKGKSRVIKVRVCS